MVDVMADRYDVFVATPYEPACAVSAGADYRAYVETLCTHLERHGVYVYAAPRNEAWGAERPARHVGIMRDYSALHKCASVIAFAGSYNSDGVLVEIGMAIALRRSLYLLRTGDGHWPAYLDGVVVGGHADSFEVHSQFDVLNVASRVVTDLRKTRGGDS